MPFFNAADGTKLHYERVGGGPPLVLHTGGAGDGSMWQDAGYVESLAAAYECFLFDHRGHGLSDRPRASDAHTMQRYADDVVELLDHCGVERAAFWGYSQGGVIGLAIGALHADRLTALLVTGGLETPDREVNASENLENARALREHGWEPDSYQGERKPIPSWFQHHFDSTDPVMAALWLEREAEWGMWSRLSSIGVPVQFFVGGIEDPERLVNRAAELMPFATVRRFEELDHLEIYIRSDLTVPIAMEFISRASRG